MHLSLFVGWVAMLTRVLLPLSVTAFSPHFDNPQHYTILWIVLTLIGAAGVFDLGFSPTFIRRISRYALSGSDEDQNAKRLASISEYQRSIYRKTSALYALFACCIIYLYFAFEYTGPLSRGWQILVATLTAVGCYFTHNAAVYRNTLIGNGRILDTKVIEVLVGLAAVSLLVFYFEAEILAILLLIVVARFSEYCCLMIRSSRVAGTQRSSIASASENKNIRNAALKSGLGTLTYVGLMEVFALMTPFVMDADQATQYMTCHRFAMMLGAFSYLPLHVVLPKMVQAFHNGALDIVKKLVRTAKVITLIMITVGGILPTMAANLNFFDLNSTFAFAEAKIWKLFIIFLIFDRMGAYNVQMQTLNEKIFWHIANGASAAGAVFSSLLLFEIYGEPAFAVSLCISAIFIYFPISVFLKRQEFAFDPIEDIFTPLCFLFIAGLLI